MRRYWILQSGKWRKTGWRVTMFNFHVKRQTSIFNKKEIMEKQILKWRESGGFQSESQEQVKYLFLFEIQRHFLAGSYFREIISILEKQVDKLSNSHNLQYERGERVISFRSWELPPAPHLIDIRYWQDSLSDTGCGSIISLFYELE